MLGTWGTCDAGGPGGSAGASCVVDRANTTAGLNVVGTQAQVERVDHPHERAITARRGRMAPTVRSGTPSAVR